MKYICIRDSAVLASRGIEAVSSSDHLDVSVMGVSDGSTFCIMHEGNTEQKSYGITSETTTIPVADLASGVYSVTVIWDEYMEDVDDTVRREARGNSFKVITNENNSLSIIPAPVSSATSLEEMWCGIANILDVLVPLVDDVKNGYNVI